MDNTQITTIDLRGLQDPHEISNRLRDALELGGAAWLRLTSDFTINVQVDRSGFEVDMLTHRLINLKEGWTPPWAPLCDAEEQAADDGEAADAERRPSRHDVLARLATIAQEAENAADHRTALIAWEQYRATQQEVW